MAISYSKLFVGISLPALCTGLASLLLSISANAQTIRPTTQKELKVFDPTTGNSGNIGIRAAAGTLSYTLTLPATAPSANQVLTANAVTGGNVTLTWATPVSGTVTSVGLSVPTGFSVSGSPVTSAGTLSLSYASGYALPTTVSQTNWEGAYNDRITAASVTGTTTKTITLTQQDGGTVTATFSDLNTDLVSSVFGRTGVVTATTGDYTTAQVTESGNLYYTDARARAAISLTTTGSSGAATYSSTSGVLNIPTYTLSGLGAIGGSGTTNYVSKFASAGTLTNSLIFDNGTSVGIGTATPDGKLNVVSQSGSTLTLTDNNSYANNSPRTVSIEFKARNPTGNVTEQSASISAVLTPNEGFTVPQSYLTFSTKDNALGYREQVRIQPNGYVGIGTTRPQSKLHVDGVITTEAGKFACLSCAGQWTTQISLLDEYGDRPHHIETLHYVNPNYRLGEDLWNALNFNINRGSQGSTDVMTLLGNGDVGIGIIAPTDKVSIAAGRLTVGFGEGDRSSLEGGDTLGSALRLYDNSNETIRLNAGANLFSWIASGNVGIGTTDPGSDKLQINESTNADLSVSLLARGGNSRYAQINFGVKNSSGANVGGSIGSSGARGGGLVLQGNTDPITENNAHLFISLGGEVRIRATRFDADSGNYNLQVFQSGVWGAGTYVNGSDSTLKKNIKLFPSSTEVLKKLRPVTYNYKSSYNKDTTIQAGFIAQEVQEALKSTDYVDGVVKKGSFLSMAYQSLIPLLTKALQESIDRIELLEKKISILEQKASKN